LFGASLKIGAIIGGANAENADNLYNFALNIGLGFQLKDDLLDTFGNEKVFGKKTGGDIITNKKTFLYLKALELADDDKKEELINLYNSNNFRENDKINRVINIFSSLNIQQITEQEIDTYFDNGLVFLNKLSIENGSKQELLKLAGRMIHRDS
jgi:geranylgeranyl diphosphate synthase type II